MNDHFEDARYYLGRAAEHFVSGVREELAARRDDGPGNLEGVPPSERPTDADRRD